VVDFHVDRLTHFAVERSSLPGKKSLSPEDLVSMRLNSTVFSVAALTHVAKHKKDTVTH